MIELLDEEKVRKVVEQVEMALHDTSEIAVARANSILENIKEIIFVSPIRNLLAS